MTEPITDADREDLTAYLDGEADPATRTRVEARLNRDPRLRAEADALRRAWELLDQLPHPELSTNFTSRTLDRISALRPASAATIALPGPARHVPWALAAAAVAGLVLGWSVTGYVARPTQPAPLRLDDPLLVQELRLIENLPLYTAAQTLDFLQMLDHHDRFGADAISP
jgi:anti-sigma factor RsiW